MNSLSSPSDGSGVIPPARRLSASGIPGIDLVKLTIQQIDPHGAVPADGSVILCIGITEVALATGIGIHIGHDHINTIVPEVCNITHSDVFHISHSLALQISKHMVADRSRKGQSHRLPAFSADILDYDAVEAMARVNAIVALHIERAVCEKFAIPDGDASVTYDDSAVTVRARARFGLFASDIERFVAERFGVSAEVILYE